MPKKLPRRRPATPQTLARVERALAAGDIAQAARYAATALTDGQEHPLLLNLAAWAKEERRDFVAAHALLQRALALSPGDVLILGSIGALLRKQGRLDEALDVLDRVVASEPRHAAAWLERGYTLDSLREPARAADSYTRAIAVDPTLAPALGKLADAAARRGDTTTAEDYAARALALSPREPAAIAARAVLANERRDGVAAEALLTPLLAGALDPDDRTRTLTLLGDALDRQDRTAEAFARYAEAQANFRAAYRTMLEPGPSRPSHRAFVERITRQIIAGGPRPHAQVAPVPGEADRHVFLLGYPRSGTTLIENVLASASDVVALEERDTFAEIDAALLANDGSMPDLGAVDADTIAALRAAYWRRTAALGESAVGKTLVDMNPFNGVKLPLIARLFPDARIVIMRRDPRDVVLSCYRINFTPGSAAWGFADLTETARHYDALMRLIDAAIANLPLAYHEVRYHRLVADFAPTVRALADFIGLPWTDDFLTFDRTARTRGVRTASETQVRKGLYDGGGQWRRYEAQLAPVLPILTPWVTRFGTDT